MDINKFDFFELIGLQDILFRDKKKIIQEISEIAWEKFLLDEVEKKLGEEDIKTVNDMVQEGRKVEEIVGFISRKMPNFNDSFLDFIERVKIDMINRQFAQMITNLNHDLLSIKDSNKEASVKHKLDRYIEAKELLDKKDWGSLHGLMTKNLR